MLNRTFGSSLILRTSGLIILSLLVFALGSYRLILRPTVTGLARAEMGMVSQQVEAHIQRLLDSVEGTLRTGQGWGINGDLDFTQVQQFNGRFIPIISNHREISAVIFAHESGRELFLLHTQDGKWVNRLSDPARWGKKSYLITWNGQGQFEKMESLALGYDARTRPWFKGAMTLADAASVHWTEPYTFFSIKEPGVTASMRWQGKDGSRFVIAHDVKLLDLSRFTTTLQLGQRGVATLMGEDGTLLALPASSKFVSDEQLKAAVLKTAEAVGLPAVAAGYAAWQAAGKADGKAADGRYTEAGENWFSSFRPIAMGTHKVWLATFAPESEFIPGQARDLLLLLLIAAAALVVASLVALRVARRFAAPLEELTRESERIGNMNLDRPVAAGPLNAPWREVVRLAQAQEIMRRHLLEAKTSLEAANEQLEAKVEERTSELAHQAVLVAALLDTIPNPIFYKGADTRFIGCNRAYEDAFGIYRGEFIGKRVLDLDYLPEADRRAYQAEDEAVIRDCSRVCRADDIPMADGKLHHTLYSVTGFRNPDGSPGGLIGLIVDVTTLKDAEQAAREARALAEAAAATKAEFLANMSHEIRTPMNAIIGMTRLALQTELNPRQRNYLDKVNAAADGLLNLINDILDFSKIEAGKLSCERVEFALDSVINHVADLAGLRARDKGLELLFDVAGDVPPVLLGDPLRLGQVLNNLVGNALKFTERGEITLTVSLLAEDEQEILLRFEVRDTGIGMDQAQLGHVFSAFAQGDSSTTRRYGGTGLGLSISKRIVELMGGEIGVSSQPGQGSRFFFSARFGLAKEAAAPVLRSIPDVRSMPALVVDDNATAREVFQHMLQALGFPTRVVPGGAEALAEMDYAREAGQPYRLALIDWKMPGLNGVETLRQIRARFGAEAPICLLATAHDRDSLALELADTVVDGMLDKPVTASSLMDAVMTACSPQLAAVRVGQTPRQRSELKQVLTGARVLLAEDNETNQELVVDLLQKVGIVVDTANNGQQALDLLAQNDYALVLMDCQMPLLDGLEATRRLRAQPRFHGLPIIALTANAMAGEREKCLAAGMNDYLAKPIDFNAFYAMLLHWLVPDQAGRLVSPSLATPPPRAVPARSQAPFPLDRVSALARMGGDQALYQRLLERFRDREKDAASQVRAALMAGELESARRRVHNLKGLAANIGADVLAAACRHLEYHLDGSDQAASLALEAWQRELTRLLALIAAAPASANDVATDLARDGREVVKQGEVAGLMRTLARQLEQDNAKASRSAEQLAQLFAADGKGEGNEQGNGAHQLASQLVGQVVHHANQYDYDRALVSLRELAAHLQCPL